MPKSGRVTVKAIAGHVVIARGSKKAAGAGRLTVTARFAGKARRKFRDRKRVKLKVSAVQDGKKAQATVVLR